MEKIALFGVGLTLNHYFNMLNYAYDIKVLVDNDKNKVGKCYFGKPCEFPEKLRDYDLDKIVILTMWEKYYKEIEQQLISLKVNAEIVHINRIISNISKKSVYSLEHKDIFDNIVNIDNNCSIGNLDILFIGTRNIVKIHSNVRVLGKLQCVCRGDNNIIEIGRETSIISARIEAAESGKVSIGEDCMLASEINIFQSACHLVFDQISSKRINQSKDIKIGNHVWIGERVGLMPGFSIGDGSIIGYGSVSSSHFGQNCTIAGSPARCIRKNVCWSREAVGYES